MIYDLIVVGAGPAGCAAAISAVRGAARVLLLERGRFPRHKVCGEFVSAESLDLLHNLLAPDQRHLVSEAMRIDRGRIFADGAKLEAEISPPAASITRFDMDSALWDSCIQSGVEAGAECTVEAVEGTGPFKVTTRGECFHGKALINATGRWSNLTSSATRAGVSRAGVSKERWVGVKAHFREASAPASVDLYFFDGGYCGVQPVRFAGQNGSGVVINACAMVRTVDPFIGDGISLALRSGALAAERLEDFFRGDHSLEQATVEYCRLYKQRLAPVFRASSWLRRMLRWPGVVRKPVLSLLEKTPSITSRLVRMTR